MTVRPLEKTELPDLYRLIPSRHTSLSAPLRGAWRWLVAFSFLLVGVACEPTSTGTPTQDLDGDGIASDEDCDDNNANVSPSKPEICDGLDQDCDSEIDEDPTDAPAWYTDADADTYGTGSPVYACEAPTGTSGTLGDCDDANNNIHPGASEVCNEVDDNCNNSKDEGVESTFYLDDDGDGFGNPTQPKDACEAPKDYVDNDDDCDDSEAAINPEGTESCNGLDDNCNTTIDEGFGGGTFYLDADDDTYGDPSKPTAACVAPPDHVVDNTDCNDANPDIFPGAEETCNLLDDNCDDAIDEGIPTSTFYADADGDGYGNAGETADACQAPDGMVSNDDDCNDNAASAYPGAAEICNTIDDNCNDQVDEGSALSYQDLDKDGFGDPAVSSSTCPAPSGYVGNAADCDDGNNAINPQALESCNFQDDNCNGLVDDGISYLQLATGEAHGLALCSDKTVWAWGFNGSGQLGDGSFDPRTEAVKVANLADVIHIAAGSQHSLAVKADGTVWAWGDNGLGQLGDGTTVSRNAPKQVTLPGVGKATRVAGGAGHSLALLQDGTLAAWGDNSYGQVGDASNTQRKNAVAVPGLTGVSTLAAGGNHTVVMLNSRELWVWGANNYGQLGLGDTTARNAPARLSGLDGPVDLAGGQGHSLVVLSDGSVWAFGRNMNGQLGNNSTTNALSPVKVSGLSGISGVGAGIQHSLAVSGTGTVYAWGANWEGQLGTASTSACDPNQPTAMTCVLEPTLLSGISGIESVEGGYLFSAALSEEGSIWTWGNNALGQLGDGTTTSNPTPSVVVGGE